MPPNPALRAIVDLRQLSLQKSRLAFNNRVKAIEDGRDNASPDTAELLARWRERFETLEKEADRDIARFVADTPIVQHMIEIKGIAELLAAKLICMIDIEKAPTVSALWKYSGYGQGEYWQDAEGKIVAPVKGYQWKVKADKTKEKVLVVVDPKPDWIKVTARDRPIEGFMLSYNRRIKTTVYLIASQFLRVADSPYAPLYAEAYETYLRVHPEWGRCDTCGVLTLAECSDPVLHRSPEHRQKRKGGKYLGWKTDHINLSAMRKMGKVFLAHLWERWRKLEGLPTPDLYVLEKMGHTHYLAPEDFGWPPFEK